MAHDDLDEDDVFVPDAEDDDTDVIDDAGAVDDVARTVTQPPLNTDRLARSLFNLPSCDQLFRSMIESVVRLHQTHGDADAALADQLADIESALRTHALSIHADPSGWLLSLLAVLEPPQQLAHIDQLLADLTLRRAQLTAKGR